jgi:RNA polymerase sigma-70 factor, ECF subfamily
MPHEAISALEAEVTRQYQRFRTQVFRYALGSGASEAEADDLVQEAFLRFFLALLAGDEIRNPQAWLLATTRNLWITRLRDKARRKETPLADVVPQETVLQECTLLGELEHRQLWEQMLSLLAPRERACVELRGQGMAYDEIARRLGISGGTVGVLLHRARRRLTMTETQAPVLASGPAT